MISLRLVPFLLLGFLFWSPLRGQSRDLDEVSSQFPRQGFEVQIEFWEGVFTRYRSHQVLFHDAQDLRLIYAIEEFQPEENLTPAQIERQQKRIRMRRDEYRRHIDQIRRLGPGSHSLSTEQQSIVKVLRRHGDPLTSAALRTRARQLRAQRGIKEKFRAGLIRSGRYLDRAREIFRRRGLPEELVYLPHIESSFDYSAYSRAGAAGIWQFTRSTGRYYLQINQAIDERLDPLRASEAAAQLLTDNYQALGNWPLAITAYNYGKYGMLRAKAQYGSNLRRIIAQYRSRSFGFASKNFYAEFLAAVQVAQNYQAYFGNLELEPPLRFENVRLKRAVDANYLTAIQGLSSTTLADLNPHLTALQNSRRAVLPAGITLRVPPGRTGEVETTLAGAPTASFGLMVADDGSMSYLVQRGDSLGMIASRLGVPSRSLQRLNGIANPNRIYPGQVLRVASEKSLQKVPPPEEPRQRYRVVAGDSLAKIAKRFTTSPRGLQQANGIRNPNQIRPGQILIIPEETGTTSTPYRVQPGDSLAKVAQRFGTSASALQQANSLSNPNHLRVGQILHIPATGSASRTHYRVRRGDTLGKIARLFEVSVQRLIEANSIRNANQIRLGQVLLIPGPTE